MKIVASGEIMQRPGPTQEEYASAITRSAKHGAIYSLLLNEDVEGNVWIEPVNVPSVVHQQGILTQSAKIFNLIDDDQ